jgi:hypothetical protein
LFDSALPTGSRPAAAARPPFNRVAARCRCATSARPWPPRVSTRNGRRMRHSASESLPTGSRPAAATRPPRVRVAARWRYMAPARFWHLWTSPNPQPNKRFYYFRVTLSRLAARSRYAAPACPARGPQPLCGSGPTLASSGRAQPGHMPSSAPSESAAPVPTLARTFARGATALALSQTGAERLGGGKR